MLKNNHLCIWYTFVEPFSVKQIIKRVSVKTEGVISENYDINSLSGGHCTLYTDLLQANMLYSLSRVLKSALKLTKSLHHLLRNFRTRRFFYREGH